MVVDGGVDGARLYFKREGQADAVDLEGLDVEAARRIIDAVGFLRLHLNARHGLEQVVDVVELEILDLGAGDDADRLGRFALRQREAHRRRLFLDRIIILPLGPLAGDDDLGIGRRGRGFGGGDSGGSGGDDGQQGRHERAGSPVRFPAP